MCIDPFMPRRCVFSLNAVNFFSLRFLRIVFLCFLILMIDDRD